MKKMNMQQLLACDKFEVDDEEHHIVLNKEVCRSCQAKPCIYACPAGLYTLKDGEINFDDAGCLECGTCRLICPQEGALSWHYPRGNFGVVYRYG
ncbi:MAG: 4Fe-4S dicluster domain-containing protein [Syntrophomonadaceae bacterium]|nr:4Fe-4S dicluster domain-containing protein [Syntrophomonadaceae bacterium]MDD3889637.1 4Fe-4S dicluster domain-containing protein [Syntrophomonadaceae bacterium]MDD4549043.1 4Fe-4S dicluster domain-containing protein [Syntrophomonadaceae bacterium]